MANNKLPKGLKLDKSGDPVAVVCENCGSIRFDMFFDKPRGGLLRLSCNDCGTHAYVINDIEF